jgi:hypothetical protein
MGIGLRRNLGSGCGIGAKCDFLGDNKAGPNAECGFCAAQHAKQ